MRSRDSLKGVDVKIVSGARAAAREARITKALFEWSLSTDALLSGDCASLDFPAERVYGVQSQQTFIYSTELEFLRDISSHMKHIRKRQDTTQSNFWTNAKNLLHLIAFFKRILIKLCFTHASSQTLCIHTCMHPYMMYPLLVNLLFFPL